MSSVHIRLWFRRGEIQQIQLHNTYLWKPRCSAQKKKTAAANSIKIFLLIGYAGFSISTECAIPWSVYYLTTHWNLGAQKNYCSIILRSWRDLFGFSRKMTGYHWPQESPVNQDHFVTQRDVEVSLVLISYMSWSLPEVVLLCRCKARQDCTPLGKIGCCRPFLNEIFASYVFLSPALQIWIKYCRNKM